VGRTLVCMRVNLCKNWKKLDREKVEIVRLGVLVGRKILGIQKSYAPPSGAKSTARRHHKGISLCVAAGILMAL